MDRKKQITPITDADFEAVINNSVMGAGSRLVGSAQEQKALFVRPIADKSGASAMSYIKQLVEQLVEVIAEGDVAVDELTSAVGEAAEEIKKKLTKTTTPNRIYGTDAHGRYKLYELNEVGDIIGGEGEIGDIFQFVQERPEEGMKNVLYFVLKPDEQSEENDLFDEWVWANKGTAEEPVYDWEYVGTKKISIDTSLFVKFTDYATASKAGVSKFLSTRGIGINANGEAYIERADKSLIEGKLNPYRPIVPATNDLAWKVAATTNTEEWTDEDKAKACETIGAMRAVPAFNDSPSLVVINKEGVTSRQRFSSTPANYAIPISNSKGNIKTNTPEEDLDCVPKKYAEDNFVGKTKTSGARMAYTNAEDGSVYMMPIDYVKTPYSLVRRNNTQIKTVTPEADDDVPNKKYVDDIATTNEAWTFVLEDGSTVVKRVALKAEETE